MEHLQHPMKFLTSKFVLCTLFFNNPYKHRCKAIFFI